MALDSEAIVKLLAGSRVSAACPTVESLARQASALSQTVELVVNNILTTLIDIINNGGGGATTPAYILRARVNQVGHVPADQEAFAFDGATDLLTFSGLPSGFTDGIAQNPGRGFQDNEVIEVITFNGTTWLAGKLADNVISARVNKPGDVVTGDAEFPFDNAAIVKGSPLPAGGSGIAVNIPAKAFANNELIVLELIESGVNAGKWRVIQDDDDVGGGTGGGTDYDADWGISPSALANGRIEINREGSTLYDGTKEQIMGHDAGGNFLHRGVTRVILDL